MDYFAEHPIRIKMGEVFRLHNKAVILACIHCAEEFEYFTEFTLHVQEHLYQLTEQNRAIVLVEDIGNSEDLEIKTDLTSHVDQQEAADPNISWRTSQSSSDDAVFDGETEAFELNVAWNDDSSEEEEVREADGNRSCKVEEKGSYENKLLPMISAGGIQPVVTNEKTRISDNLRDGPKLGSSIRSSISRTAAESSTVNKSKKPTQTIRKATKTHMKPKSPEQIRYDALIREYQAKTSDSDGLRKLNLFRMQVNVFPSNVADTPESRFFASHYIKSATYEKAADRYLCPFCNKDFPDKYAIRRHILSHTKRRLIECGLCTKTFRIPRNLQQHLKRIHKNIELKFECYLCHMNFPNHRYLKHHMDLRHMSDVYCSLCDKQFPQPAMFKAHMEDKHANSISRKVGYQVVELKQIVRNITLFECAMCHKEFRSRRQLRVHMRLHTQEPKLCLVCGAKYATATTLHAHMLLHDADGVKAHSCDICGKRFAVRRYLLMHRRKMHKLGSDNKPLKRPTCTICSEEFERTAQLFEHMKIHPYQEPRNFICPVCNFAAINAKNLLRHMDSHTDARPFECPICHKMFREGYGQDHMRTHSSPGYTCKVCDKVLKRPSALRRHLKVIHGGDPADHLYPRKNVLPKHRAIHDVPIKYHCEWCDKSFTIQKTYELHRATHIKEEVKAEGLTAPDENDTLSFG